MIDELEMAGVIPKGNGRPPKGETVPRPRATDAIVFKDFFACGLQFPAIRYLLEVLESFKVQLHHLTPNGILALRKFCWAFLSYGTEPNLETFCEYYELQWQPKKVGKDNLEAQYGSCTLVAKRAQKEPRLEICFCQKNKVGEVLDVLLVLCEEL